jgi:ABC-type transporter Mla subunit MlaD
MSRYVWVGLFFFVGVFLLIVMSMRVDDEGHVFKGEYRNKYTTVMKKIGTVGQGSLVRMAGTGIRIGRVEGVDLKEVDEHYEYELTFSVKDKVNGLEVKIREDSVAKLAMTTLLQGMHLEITPGTPRGKPLPVGGNVTSVEAGSLMETMANMGDAFKDLGDGGLGRMLLGKDGAEKVSNVLGRIDQDGGLGKWVLGNEAQNDLGPAITELRKTLENARKGTEVEGKGAIARLLHDEKLGENLDVTIADLRESVKGLRKFTTDISEGKGAIARLASDEKLGESLDGMITDLRAVAGDLRGGKSMLARLISDEDMGKQLKGTIENLATFADGLAKGEGTLARLINDPELYVEASRLVTGMAEAVEDAREAAPISAFTSMLFGAIQ